MLRWLTAIGATATMAVPAAGQECQTALQSYPPAWSVPQTKKPADTARMKLFIETRCQDYDSMIVVEVSVGPPSVNFRSMAVAQKIGSEHARAIVSDLRQRSEFANATIAGEQQSSPGCATMAGSMTSTRSVGSVWSSPTWERNATAPQGNYV